MTRERPAPGCAAVEDAYKAVFEVGLIAEILLDMANADIAGSRGIQAPSVEYLARKIRAAADVIDAALSTVP